MGDINEAFTPAFIIHWHFYILMYIEEGAKLDMASWFYQRQVDGGETQIPK
jgi:hypothetical protein